MTSLATLEVKVLSEDAAEKGILGVISISTSFQFSFDASKVTQNDIITLTPLVNYACGE